MATQQHIQEKRWQIYADIIEGFHIRQIMARNNVGSTIVHRIANENNLTIVRKSGSGRKNANPARNAEIVEMRREGKTYDEIGSKFGITRERVRQILNRDAADLTGHINRPEPDYAPCPVCQKPVRAPLIFCSKEHMRLYEFGKPTPLQERLGPKILEMRESGMAWDKISQHFGQQTSYAPNLLQVWADKLGKNIDHLFARKNGMDCRKSQA